MRAKNVRLMYFPSCHDYGAHVSSLCFQYSRLVITAL